MRLRLSPVGKAQTCNPNDMLLSRTRHRPTVIAGGGRRSHCLLRQSVWPQPSSCSSGSPKSTAPLGSDPRMRSRAVVASALIVGASGSILRFASLLSRLRPGSNRATSRTGEGEATPRSRERPTTRPRAPAPRRARPRRAHERCGEGARRRPVHTCAWCSLEGAGAIEDEESWERALTAARARSIAWRLR